MNNTFKQHYSGLWVAEDGEVLVPKSGVHKGHYTYGSKQKYGHRNVVYKGKSYKVHKLVAEVFLNNNKPIDGERYAVHHIKHIPDDNRVENLVILTHSEHTILHHTGKPFTEETKRKLSEMRKGNYTGEKNSMFGRLGTNNPKSKPVICINKTSGEKMEFAGAAEAGRVLGISSSNITKCCKGRLNSTGNYYWQYA